MGRSYQTILAVAEEADVRRVVERDGRLVAVTPVGEGRWAVVPQDENGYAATFELAVLISRHGYAATFEVLDSDALAATIYRNGKNVHEYVSNQAVLIETQDENGEEIVLDMLWNSHPADYTPPRGPAGADPDAFAPLGIEPIDRAELAEALNDWTTMGDSVHHAVLHALNLEPGPLQRTYEESV
jgi:hypothetical protein